MKTILRLAVLFLHLSFAVTAISVQDVNNCSCGFYDPTANLLFTDSLIVYFNETHDIPSNDLVVESFEHRYDLGWNTIYRQGATVENVKIVNDSTARNLTGLGMYCNPSDDKGLVLGASMRTARRDIFFGSFRSSMRAPRKWLKGSALSMVLDHNKTERWDIDTMNTDNSTDAWVSMLMAGEFSSTWLGTNFTNITAAGLDPWFYLEYRVDWTRDRIDYYVGNILWKTYTIKENGTLPSTPAPLRWQHWSLGNAYSTQGPPLIQSEANIGWTRIFFNSSLVAIEEQQAFDARCAPSDACLMNNNQLRGSTNYSEEALRPWKQHHPKWTVPCVPLIVVIAFSGIFAFITVKTLWRRFSWDTLHEFLGIKNKRPCSPTASAVSSSSDTSTAPSSGSWGRHGSSLDSPDSSCDNIARERLGREGPMSATSLPTYSGVPTPAPQYQSPSSSAVVSRASSRDDMKITPLPYSYFTQTGETPPVPPIPSNFIKEDREKSAGKVEVGVVEAKSGIKEIKSVAVSSTSEQPSPLPRQQVEYLAGFIALSALLVTLNHFGLTFWASVIIPSVRPHYKAETWARKTIASYFLDPLWIGPFLMISTRFLVSNYLRTGKLDNMAQKIVSRPFRLLTPVAAIATLEYFLTDSGALAWLEYLPSVTWSSWPFTSIVENPGVFISEIIQLAYLIPNAAPMITYNYCTGVLWTIPIQLQGAWQTLIALIVVKECKTPWKRFSFYAFCIVNHWYGLSWGSYYYAGVMLADLDLTYKYKLWLHARWWAYYPLLFVLVIVALGGFTIDMVTQWTGVNYAAYEYGWHPDTATGLTISQAGNSVYPDYFIPRLNALLTTVSMQAIVEICPAVQKVLSIKPLQWLFPHIFTIYLIHGFIFWSVGSWAMISIFSYGCPYWLCVLLTAIICYGTLFASLPLLTPPIEAVGKNFTLRLWEHASQEPIIRKPTLYPFSKELIMRNVEGAGRAASVTDSSLSCEEKSDKH
ncbi:hypothetical protein F5884DRAFT_402827 [Xylogone sp. PMI_703]|nr:hypothetical protein F5884DRAFT_402827 [Xylogone sp. PMI_703]